MTLFERIRLFGDPVLRQRATEVRNVDACVARMCQSMVRLMSRTPLALGIAAPQVGAQQRIFVYALDDDLGPQVVINPEIRDHAGECGFFESCLSLPGVGREIIRPAQVYLVGRNLDGNEVSVEADGLAARLFQHEVDHLDGVMMIDLLSPDERAQLLSEWRDAMLRADQAQPWRPVGPSRRGSAAS